MILVLNFHLDSDELHTPSFVALDSLGTWLHAKPDTFLLSTNRSPDEIAGYLRHLATHEPRSIRELTADSLHYLPQIACNWVAEQTNSKHSAIRSSPSSPPQAESLAART
jgi:hypothetical protein